MLKERLGVRRVQRKKYILLIYLWFPVLQIIEGIRRRGKVRSDVHSDM